MADEYHPKAVADAVARIAELNAKFLDPSLVPDNSQTRAELQGAARTMKDAAEYISRAASALLGHLGVEAEPTPFVVSSKSPRGW
jgi:hypothetical protein